MSTPTYEGLQVVDLLGVFYESEGRLMVSDEFEGTVDVLEELSPLSGKLLRLVAHHRPPHPVDKTRWGGGCCHLENTGFCPFGHHENPANLYTYNAVGKLSLENNNLVLEQDSGSNPLQSSFLLGHRGQIIVTTIPDLEDIRSKVKEFDPSNIENPTLENLTERLSELRDFLSQMNTLKEDL